MRAGLGWMVALVSAMVVAACTSKPVPTPAEPTAVEIDWPDAGAQEASDGAVAGGVDSPRPERAAASSQQSAPAEE